MIDFKLTEEQELLLESAEEFIKQGNYDEYRTRHSCPLRRFCQA